MDYQFLTTLSFYLKLYQILFSKWSKDGFLHLALIFKWN